MKVKPTLLTNVANETVTEPAERRYCNQSAAFHSEGSGIN